jgi:hypothetical protein
MTRIHLLSIKAGCSLFAALALFALALAAPCAAHAQSAASNMGTDFYLAFPTGPGNLRVEIAGSQAATGTVDAAGTLFPFTFTPGVATSVVIPASLMLTAFDGVEAKAIHVSATAPVSVTASQGGSSSADTFLALPVTALGRDYIALSYAGGGANGQSILAVVGVEAQTTVTITPSATVASKPAGVPYTVTLAQGEVYQIRDPAPYGDVTGTRVTSDKPVAVLSANTCADVPVFAPACDNLVEMLPPVDALGQTFVTTPMTLRLDSDVLRVVAAHNGTAVTINGVLAATLNAGGFVETLCAGPTVVQASAPVLLGQYARGTSLAGRGDPLMMLVPATAQWRSKYDFSAIDGATQFGAGLRLMTIAATPEAVATLALDGAPLVLPYFTSWTPVPGTTHSVVWAWLEPGAHAMTAKGKFAVNVYWFGTDISFGHPAGLSYPPHWQVDALLLNPAFHNGAPGAQHCVSAVALNGDLPVVGVTIAFTVAGAHTTSGTATTDALGVATFCYATSQQGDDQISATVGGIGASATAQWLVPNQPPTAICQPQTVAANIKCTACASIDGGSHDPDSLVWTVAQTPECKFPLGQTLATLTITDLDGANAACEAPVTVVDVTPPSVSGCTEKGTFVKLNESCNGETQLSANATDNCTAYQQQTAVVSFSAPGSQSHTFVFADAAGNTASCTQGVTALDVTPPVIVCPPPAQISLSPENCKATYSAAAKAVDACEGEFPVAASTAFVGPGQTLLTYTAADASGNSAVCSQPVEAVDVTPPVFVAAEIQELSPLDQERHKIKLSSCGAAFDACGGAIDLDGAHAEIVQITSDEPETSPGDSTMRDMRIENGNVAKLRAERSNKGDGRVYTIHFNIVDASKNVTAATCQVHARRHKKAAAVDSGVVWAVP